MVRDPHGEEDWDDSDTLIKENKEMEDKIKTALDFITQTIKGTEWEGKVYMAGGGVRDEIMGNPPKDIDLLINVPDGGIKFAEWITKELGIYRKYRNPVIYPRFGTAKFTLRKQKHNSVDISDVDIECVMPRKEVYTKGDRKPDVYQGTLKDDVDRRDFTSNSLLKDLSSGEILDLTGMGRDDIKKGIIRTPLDPDIIFTEDPLRMLRAVRFSVKYDWDLPLFMIRSIKRNAKQLQNISSERIQEELNKMIVTDFPDKAIRIIQITGLSKYIFPELDKLKNLTQNKFHKYDAMRHTLEVLKNTPPDLITRLAALFHDIGKAKTKEIIDNEIHFYEHEKIGSFIVRDIMKRLRYPSEIINAVVAAVENHMRTKQTGDEGKISDRSLRKLRQDLGDHLQSTLDLIHADNISHSEESNMPNQVSNIRRRFVELEEKDKNAPKKSPLNGDDIMDILGIKKGPIVGKILKILGDMYLDDPNMSKEELTEIVKKSYEELK
jgi:poly(A) polymerase